MAQGHSIDEYLETIYFLAFPIGEYTPRGAGSPPLASRVAEMLHVSRASAGEMLKRLEAEGLIERGERKEALLTASGRQRAERVVRKHRIIERLLTDFMGYTAYEAHERADELGDTFDDEMVERVAELVGPLVRLVCGVAHEVGEEPLDNSVLADDALGALAPARGEEGLLALAALDQPFRLEALEHLPGRRARHVKHLRDARGERGRAGAARRVLTDRKREE